MASPVGRRTKYTPETVDKIVAAIELGSTYELACGYAGITYTTFAEWINTKPEFSAIVKAAEGSGAYKWLEKIEKAANDGNWQAAAWKLERRYPRDYGRQAVEVSGPNGGPIEITDARERVAQLLTDSAARRAKSGDSSGSDGQGSGGASL